MQYVNRLTQEMWQQEIPMAVHDGEIAFDEHLHVMLFRTPLLPSAASFPLMPD